MPRLKADAPALSPEKLARKHGMSVLRGPQHRVAQRPAAPTEERALPGAMEVPIDRVLPDPNQPRRDWSHDDGERRLDELSASIREFGVIQPLLVREGAIRSDGAQEFIVIAGGRRRTAAECAGLATVPVIVRGDEGARVRVVQLLENLQRQQLSPLDEARAFQELIDIEALTPPLLGARLKISDQVIRDRLRLLTNQVVADALERKQLNLTAARTLQQLPDEELATFKARLQRGEEIRHAEIEAHRQRLIAAGVINPRFKGGGKRTAAHDVRADQSSFDRTTGVGPFVALHDTHAAARRPGDERSAPPPVERGAMGAWQDQTKIDPVASAAPTVSLAEINGPTAPPTIDGDHPAAIRATARELGTRIWRYLPKELQATVRELACVEPSLAWGTAVAEGLAQNIVPADEGTSTSPGDQERPARD